jgi:hypothetical protein
VTEIMETPAVCNHGVRWPWQCDDCDRENPPTRADLDAIMAEASKAVAECDQRLMLDP